MSAPSSNILAVAGSAVAPALVVAAASAMQVDDLIRIIRGHPEVLYFVDTDRPVIALTIDDGPDAETTPLILDVLARYEAAATFFVIAERIRGNEALMKRIVAAGHEIGNHMTRDEPSIELSAADFESELLKAHRALSVYAVPRWFRPGSGWYDEDMLATLKKHHYRCVLGTVYPFDTHNPSSWLVQKVILAMAKPGRIIVLHHGGRRGKRTVQTLEAVLPQLRQRGIHIGTLSELSPQGPKAGTIYPADE